MAGAGDPIYDAYMAAIGFKKQAATDDAARQKEQIQADLAGQLPVLGDTRDRQLRGLNSSLEDRGIYSSGDADYNRGNLQADYLRQVAEAQGKAARGVSDADYNLKSSLGGYDVDLTGAMGDSQAREAQKNAAIEAENRNYAFQQQMSKQNADRQDAWQQQQLGAQDRNAAQASYLQRQLAIAGMNTQRELGGLGAGDYSNLLPMSEEDFINQWLQGAGRG